MKKLKEELYGCGTTAACTIVSEVGDIDRFKSESHFASYAIVSPKERSSASRTKILINKMGNKNLNKALHYIALAQIAKDTDGKKYYEKKLQEGKSKLSALRSLKRYIARRVYTTLKQLSD